MQQQANNTMSEISKQVRKVQTIKTPFFTAKLDIDNAPYFTMEVQVNSTNQTKVDVYSTLIAMTIDKILNIRDEQVQTAIEMLPPNARNNEQLVMKKLPMLLRQVHQKHAKSTKYCIGEFNNKPVLYYYDRQILGNNCKRYNRKLDKVAGVPAIEVQFDAILSKYPEFKQFLDADKDAVTLEVIKVIESAHVGAIEFMNTQHEVAKKTTNKCNNKRVKYAR